MPPRLAAISGKLKGAIFAINEETLVIGRETAANLCMADASVSRRHCKIEKNEKGFVITDRRRASLARRDVSRRLGSAPGLVPLVTARGRRHPRRAAVQERAHARVHRGRRRPEDVEVARQLHHDGRAVAQVRRGDPPPVGRRRGLHRGHPDLLRRSSIVCRAYRRMRNTCRFLLGNLADFDPARDRRPYAQLDDVDRFVLDRLGRLIARVTRAYDEYEFHTVFHAVQNFCAVDLSAIYLDVIKDRLYTSLPDDPDGVPRRPCATTSSRRWRGSWRRS